MRVDLELSPGKSGQDRGTDKRMHYSEKPQIKHTSKESISPENAESVEGWDTVEHSGMTWPLQTLRKCEDLHKIGPVSVSS